MARQNAEITMNAIRWSRRATALPVTLILLCVACAGSRPGYVPPGTTQPDKFLFDRGTTALQQKRWVAAREYFKTLVDSYTQSTYRPDAKLGIGDSYLGENSSSSLIEAIGEFRDFLTYWPTNRRADYAQFKLAMAHFQQMRGPQRDQTETKDAITELRAFVERYPTSSLIEEGRAKLREAQDRLSESDYLVGFFYFRSRWYPGAEDRFKSLLKSDPEYTGRDAVYFYLGETLVKLKREAEALPLYERLLQEFDRSDYLQDAQRRIAELKTDAKTETPGQAQTANTR
jgi:outer membrane protein assembly factor BamD